MVRRGKGAMNDVYKTVRVLWHDDLIHTVKVGNKAAGIVCQWWLSSVSEFDADSLDKVGPDTPVTCLWCSINRMQ